ncbi:GGDEF domain-containing protein [Thermosulfuriphilus sp.]
MMVETATATEAQGFAEKIRLQHEALMAAWVAFLKIQKEKKVPYPAIYQRSFSEALRLEKKNNALLEILSESRSIMEGLLGELQASKEEFSPLKTYFSRMQEHISRIKTLEEELSFLRESYLRDHLTKLWNERALEKFYLEVIRPHIFQEDYVFIYFDLNKFKAVNDSLGHQAGDEVLRAFARYLKSQFKTRDFVCRLHGDEFVVVATGVTLEKTIPFLKYLAGQTLSLSYKGIPISLSFTLGATNVIASDSLATILERADGAMYHHKHRGQLKWVRV